MLDVKKILFPTDFSESSMIALEHARTYASLAGAELHILHAIILHEEESDEAALSKSDGSEHKLQEAVSYKLDALDTRGLPTVRARKRGFSATNVILEYAQEHQIDLIVMGTHGRRGLRHLMMGSVAEEVVRLASCPVVTVRTRRSSPAEHLKSILVPVDFSDHSRHALRQAKILANKAGATLHLLYVFETPTYPAFYQSVETVVLEKLEVIHARSRHELQTFYRDVPGPLPPASYHVITGRPIQEIVKVAEQYDCDLIIMATHGLTGLDRLLMGSTTENVLRVASCPVLTLKLNQEVEKVS